VTRTSASLSPFSISAFFLGASIAAAGCVKYEIARTEPQLMNRLPCSHLNCFPIGRHREQPDGHSRCLIQRPRRSGAIASSRRCVQHDSGVTSLTNLIRSSARAGIGGAGALLFPHFVQGGWWSTEIIPANVSIRAITVRRPRRGGD
jgi:hypothetical protein